jgi:hypothetical protein
MTVRELIKAEVSSLTPPRTFSSSRMVVLATNDKVVLAISEQSQ